MAAKQLVLSDPLCFIVNKLGKVPLIPLKKLLNDFYSAEDIAKAKSQLLRDIESLDLSDKPPRVSNRRDGESRQVRETDDIISQIIFLDEHKLLSTLPTYVTDNPDKMPTLRLFDGDLSFLSARLDKLDDTLSNHGSMLATIVNDGHHASRPTYASVVAPRGVINNNSKRNNSVPGGPVSGPASTVTTVNTVSSYSGSSKPVVNENDKINSDQLKYNERALWSARMNSSSSLSSIPNKQRLRLASDQAAVSDIESIDAHGSNDEQPFTEYQNRRYAKRRRQGSPKQTSVATNVNKLTQVRRGPLIVGSSATSGGSDGSINAANQPMHKSVYCIDNVNSLYSVDDVVKFVQDLHVTVVSCFEVKPRKRYSDYGNDRISRKAFRLCIYSNDCELLLDASKWPDRVAIYEYFFKSKNLITPSERYLGHEDSRYKSRDLSRDTLSSSGGCPLPSLPSNSADSGPNVDDPNQDAHIEDNSDLDATIMLLNSPDLNIQTLNNLAPIASTSYGAV
jgi:hypothetical protein